MEHGVTVHIPVYNEERIMQENTEMIVEYLEGIGIPFEVIIHDNASNDNTSKIGAQIQDMFRDKVKFIASSKRGVGHSFKESIRASSYEYFITMDMDLSTDIGFIKKSIGLLKENDIVIGSKKIGNEKRLMTRLIMSLVYNTLTKILLGLGVSDYSPSTKAYRKSSIIDVVNNIDDGAFYATELLFLTKAYTKCTEMPIDCNDFRKTRFNIYVEIPYRIKNLFRLWVKSIC